MDYIEILLMVIVFLYGIVIGSFLNVCILRIPKGEGIAFVRENGNRKASRSHCMNCDYQLRWYDLVPVFSYLFLKGRCRKCKTKISIQYPIVELLNGILYIIIFLANGFNVTSILYCLLTSALIVLSVIDYRTYEIPISINYFILGIGLLRMITDYKNWLNYVIGFCSVSIFLLILYYATRGRGIGGGDVKLMAVAGMVVGWKAIVFGFLSGCIIGSIIQMFLMVVLKKGRMFAFGPYLAMGIYLSFFLTEPFFEWYLSLIL